MKLNSKKMIFIIFASVLFLLMAQQMSYAGYQTLNSLDFQIDIKENGDMRITELWDVDLEDTNTLFKTFPIDEGHSGITDVTVSEIEGNKEVEFKKSSKYQYHVDEDCYQALENPDGAFEIAWGVDAYDDYGRKFKISYTVLNHVFLYNDCAEIYWQLIGEDFAIYCDEITGTINLPDGITDIENLRVWAHGPLNGVITKENESTVKFNVSDLPRQTFLEIRLATPVSIFAASNKEVDSDRLQTILNEEKVFAEEANAKREELAKKQELYRKISTVVLTIAIGLGTINLVANIKRLFTEKKIKPETEWEYFRDIPDQEATPAEAGYIYYQGETGLSVSTGKIISSTLLNLSLKGWIEFSKTADKKDPIQITIKDSGKEELKEDEQEVYNYLVAIFGENKTFTMKEFEKKSEKNITKFSKVMEKIPEYAKKINSEKGIYSEKLHSKMNIYIVALIIYIFAIVMSFITFDYNLPLMIAFIIIAIINIAICIAFIGRYNGFTQKGVNELAKWKGLVKYMKEFSLLDEREVPELALWEKYLVYATAFGVADKVIKQLKVKFPEMSDEEYLRTNYTYMYFVSNSDMNFIHSIDASIGAVSNYSSESGAGGGFSSGGGGGFGGGGGGGR